MHINWNDLPVEWWTTIGAVAGTIVFSLLAAALVFLSSRLALGQFHGLWLTIKAFFLKQEPMIIGEIDEPTDPLPQKLWEWFHIPPVVSQSIILALVTKVFELAQSAQAADKKAEAQADVRAEVRQEKRDAAQAVAPTEGKVGQRQPDDIDPTAGTESLDGAIPIEAIR